METKSIIFLVFSLFAVPTGIAAVIRYTRLKDACAFMLLFGTTRYYLVSIHFFSREWYRGTSRGFQFCWLDYLWLFILAAELHGRHLRRAPRPVGLTSMLVFLAFNALNIAISEPKLFGLFELWSMFRGLLIFLTVASYVKSERELRILAWALCSATAVVWATAVYERIFFGRIRAEGALGHPNGLSIYNLIAIPVLCTVALSDTHRLLRKAAGVATVLGALSILLSASRVGLVGGALLLGAVGLTCGSLRITARKVVTAAAVLLVTVPFAYRLWPGIKARFVENPFELEYAGEVYQGRGSYLRLAHLIAADDFWGCGLNNWSYCVSNKYGELIDLHYLAYTGTDEPPPPRRLGPRSNVDSLHAPPAHSLYAITLGETGWIGVLLYGVVWLRWAKLTGSFLFRRAAAFRSRFGLGVFFGMAGAFAQSFTEWGLRHTPILFLFYVLLGAAAAIYPARAAVVRPVRPKSKS